MSGSSRTPLLLGDNRVPVYYAGGRNISVFRGLGEQATGPEDWVGSLTALPAAMLPVDAPPDTGVSRTAAGSLRELVAADPVGWLGPDLAAAYGGESGLLVKLLDAGERLPVHCHPSRGFASRHLGSVFGKTEGWIIMQADPGARVWLGMREGLSQNALRRLVDAADVQGMLAAMNEIEISAGDVVYVPAGLPHAIGPGVMLTELQEPTSFSVLADHAAFGVDSQAATLGMGWELALTCFDLDGYADRLAELLPIPRPLSELPGGRILDVFPTQAQEFFRALLVDVTGTLTLPVTSFAVLVITDGAGELGSPLNPLRCRRGQTVVVPYDAGPLEVRGPVRFIACLPPSIPPSSAATSSAATSSAANSSR